MPKLPSRLPTRHPTRQAELVPASSGGLSPAATGTPASEPGRATARVGTAEPPPGPNPGTPAILGFHPEHARPRKKAKPCTDCGLGTKKDGHPLWCADCWLRRQPISVQVAESRRRLARVPIEDHRPRVPEVPEGRRWCAGCQSARPVPDFTNGASRCRPCVSDAAHRSHQNRTFGEGGADEYDQLFQLQGGLCAICRKRQVSKRLAKDHDHKTQAVRGLLCERCNHDLLGAAYDSLRILEAAVYYLRNPPTSGRWNPEVAGADPAPF